MIPRLYILVPCYNEEAVLPITSGLFLKELNTLIARQKVSEDSRIVFIDDGSKDGTWSLITALSRQDHHYSGIRLSRNRGHQNALLAGLMEAKDHCDITISIDCDGQDDIGAMEEMVDAFLDGCQIVYGVRSSRKTDSWFKRVSAHSYYRFLRSMGVEAIYDHADYRLVSNRVLQAFADFREVNLYLRGMFPLVGFKSTCVYYERHPRIAGQSKYPLKKMVHLAVDGITSLSIRPLRLILCLGALITVPSLIAVIWLIVSALTGHAAAVWANVLCIVCFLGGIQLLCTGILGEYVGKIYMEVKGRPRFIVSERSFYE